MTVDLPSLIPLFPLPNVVLFPGLPLPLHIFEPRYREMVRAAEQRTDRLVGMVLPRGDWRERYHEKPDVFATGCAGRMVNVEPLADGRYNILLHGVREFVIDEELDGRLFREARVAWRSPVSGPLASDVQLRLRQRLARFIAHVDHASGGKVLDDPSVPDELLVNFFCYTPDFSAMEKQALLEAITLTERVERLCEVVEFAVQARRAAPPETKEDVRYH